VTRKIAFTLLIIVAVAFSAWYASSKPQKYQDSMTVWFDSAVPSLVSSSPGTTPASAGKTVLQELVGTQQFLISVGHQGPLETYFGQGRSSTQLVNPEIVATLTNAFSFTIAGPQVLRITMTATNPSYMAGTLTAVAAEYVKEMTTNFKAPDPAAFHVIDAPTSPVKLLRGRQTPFIVVAAVAAGLAVGMLLSRGFGGRTPTANPPRPPGAGVREPRRPLPFSPASSAQVPLG
jgi:hypothetical protein